MIDSIGVMSKAKWLVARKPMHNTYKILAKLANQIMPLKFLGGTKMYYICQTPLSSLELGSRLCLVQSWSQLGTYTNYASWAVV